MLQPLKRSQTLKAKRATLTYLIAFETILLVVLTAVAIQVRQIGQDFYPSTEPKVFALIVAFPIIWFFSLSLFGAWDVTILDNHIDGYRRLLKSSFITFLAFSSASYIFKIQISRFVVLFSLVGGTIIHLFLRWVFLRIADKRVKNFIYQERWLVISINAEVSPDVEKFAAQFNSEIKYFEAFKDLTEFKFWADEVASKLVRGQYSKLILSTVEGLTSVQIEHLTWVVHHCNLDIVIHDELGFTISQNQIKRHSDYKWIEILTPRINDSQRVVKRVFDLAIVVPSLILFLPLFLAIVILIKVDSRGSALYTQKRIGQDRTLFTFPKFRTMKPGSDAIRLDVIGRPDENIAERYRNDPRITRFGRLLRRYSFDELPQLWCVLTGSMSLVGPRPILPEEEEQLGDFHFRRHIAKPGLTGIWQVSGRKDTSWEERMTFDVKYVQEWSIGLDLILLARTLKVVIEGKGSY